METAPAILVVGKTGAGKSTLGNFLLGTSEHESPTFHASDSFSSVTQKCESSIIEICEQPYSLIDTPGIFDTNRLNQEILEEIAHTIEKCAFGIKAILFVLEATRFTEEQRNVIEGIERFLGKESFQYIIAVFSKCNKKQTESPELLEKSWNKHVRGFINSVGYRWAISPNSDIFDQDHPVHIRHINELKSKIVALNGIYTNDILEEVRRRQEEDEKKKKEEEERRRQEYDEIKRKEGEARAEANYLKQKSEDEERLRLENERKFNAMVNDLNKRINDLAEENRRLQSGSGCFWLKSRVKLESGMFVQMTELQIGDRVLSNIRNGIAEYSDVYLISHIVKSDYKVKFTKISFTGPDGSKGQLKLTSTHYVFTEDLSIVFAKNIRPKETKILVYVNNKLVKVLVDDVSNEWDGGYISFYTRTGTIIADGVLCSCYDHCPPSQAFMDLIFLPVRWWTLIVPSTHREEHLHPYVQFLETVYLSLVHFMKNGKRFILG